MSTHGGPYDVITQEGFVEEGFVEAGPDAAAAGGGAGTILDSGQAPSPHAQGWNKPQGETPRSDKILCLLGSVLEHSRRHGSRTGNRKSSPNRPQGTNNPYHSTLKRSKISPGTPCGAEDRRGR